MAHTEKQMASNLAFQGKILTLNQDTVLLENGTQTTRDVIIHHGGVCIAALDEDDNLMMVRQFRYPFQSELLEIPAGKLELGENPESCGRRELEEETGFIASRFEKMGELYPTPAYCTEIIHVYRATGLTPTRQKLDKDEFLTFVRIPFSEAVGKVLSGEIKDAKTQIAILRLLAERQIPSQG